MAEPARKPEEKRPHEELSPEERRELLEELREEAEIERRVEERKARLRGVEAKPSPPTSGLAIAGLVLSIVGIIPGVGLVTTALGIIFGSVALYQIGKGERSGRGLAWGAVIVGIVFFVLNLILLASWR